MQTHTRLQKKLHQRPVPQLEEPQRRIAQRGDEKRNLEPDVARVRRDGADEPDLVHARHDEAARERARAERGEARGQRARRVPVAQVVRRAVAAPDEEVLDEEHGAERGRPVADEPEEVGERVVEARRADDREGYNAVTV